MNLFGALGFNEKSFLGYTYYSIIHAVRVAYCKHGVIDHVTLVLIVLHVMSLSLSTSKRRNVNWLAA